MKTEIDTSMFWNPRQTLTHNMLINVIVGNRGGGKSFGAKQWAIDQFIKSRQQFGYIRRYKDDLKEPMFRFFDDIRDFYPDYEFKVDAGKFYIRLKTNEKQKWTDDDIAGYGFILSTANNKKSIPYPNITTLIFDEFLLDKGMQTFLNDEPVKLLSLYETVARPGTGHPRVVLFMLANAISITNPYFMFWELRMPDKQDKNGKWIWKHPTRPILVEAVMNEKFIDAKMNTEFGKLIMGTKYADYSINNQFLQDDPNTFIAKKTGSCTYWCTLVYKGMKLGVWLSRSEGRMYVSEDTDPSYPIVYSVTLQDHTPNTMLLRNKSQARKYFTFIESYKQGLVYFETVNIKNIAYEIIKITLI